MCRATHWSLRDALSKWLWPEWAVSYSRHVLEVLRTDDFDEWLTKLKDRAGRLRILKRLDRLANGNPGDVKSVGGGVWELRLDVGPGYRVYYAHDGEVLVLLLCGGDKSTQQHDIDKAHRLAYKWRTDLKEARDERRE